MFYRLINDVRTRKTSLLSRALYAKPIARRLPKKLYVFYESRCFMLVYCRKILFCCLSRSREETHAIRWLE